MDTQVTLEQAIAALRTMYGDTMENGYEDGKDAMVAALEEQLHVPKHEAKELVEGLIKARTIRWEGSAESLGASQNQSANIMLVDGIWHF